MPDAVLFDLDDTLLANDMDQFLPAYFAMLAEYASEHFAPGEFSKRLLAGVRAMVANTDASRTNYDVFWANFPGPGCAPKEQLDPLFQRFYAERFPELRALTQPVPGARELVSHCFERGLKVVIATNPVFPRAAIWERVRWAGFDPSAEPFALITSYENTHHTKPHPEYYEEIVEFVGCSPERTLMVGNDPVADIAPAMAAGLQTFEVQSASSALAATSNNAPGATLEDALAHLRGLS